MTGSTAYPNLFTPLRLRGVELPNRLVMAPMSTELGGLEGEVTPAMIAFYREHRRIYLCRSRYRPRTRISADAGRPEEPRRPSPSGPHRS